MLIFTQGIGIELLSDQHRSGSPFRYRELNSNRIQHLFKVGLLLPSEESGGPPHYLLDRGVSPVSISCTSAVKSPKSNSLRANISWNSVNSSASWDLCPSVSSSEDLANKSWRCGHFLGWGRLS